LSLIKSIAQELGLPVRGISTDKRLEVLERILSSLENVRGLNDHPGWVSILGPLEAELETLDSEIHRLNHNPVKNEKEILWLNALYEVQTKFLKMFERNLAHYKSIMSEYKRLQTDAEEIGGQRERT